jgi:STIP1 homology and U-box containing protein 1
MAIHHPNEALTSALRAYELCAKSTAQTSNAQTIAALVLKCKKAKWEVRERERLRRRNDLLRELEEILERDMKKDVEDIKDRVDRGEMGPIEAKEETEELERTQQNKINDLRSAFAISDPNNLTKRVQFCKCTLLNGCH